MRANAAPLTEATMLIVPLQPGSDLADPDIVPLGPSCRICPRKRCAGRREPSILSDGF